MEDSTETKTVKVPSFDGDETNYQRWWMRFKAYAKMTGFHKALEITPEVDLPSTEAEALTLTGSTDDEKKQLAAVKRNDTAISSLTLAFTTDELLDMILEAQDKDWSDGLACKVIK